MQIEFSHFSSYKYAYFYSQLLKLISYWFIVLQKVKKWKTKQKQKVEKTKKYIRNSQNNKMT